MALCLFFSAWQVGERGRLQSRDYDRTEGVIRPRPEHSKNKHGRVLPVEGELATILERQWLARRLDCPYVFHATGSRSATFASVGPGLRCHRPSGADRS